MKDVTGKHMKSKTTFGSSMCTRMLVIEPNLVDKFSPEDYENEAMEIAKFLQSVFCGKMLRELRKML